MFLNLMMKTIMANDSSLSFSRRYFNWRRKPEDVVNNEDGHYYNDEEALTNYASSHSFSSLPSEDTNSHKLLVLNFDDDGDDDGELEIIKSCDKKTKKKNNNNNNKLSVTKFTSFFTRSKSVNYSSTLGSKVVGTLFGYRRGHVHISFQEDSKTTPAFLIELSTPTSVLVREMASGLVRVALECDKNWDKKGVKLLQEPLWRAYCNGKKSGYAMRRECGPHEWRVLRSVGPITMGAGVLPATATATEEDDKAKADGELMYMRAKFERIVGSKDSEAFYMVNPDRSGGPELSVYLLRV